MHAEVCTPSLLNHPRLPVLCTGRSQVHVGLCVHRMGAHHFAAKKGFVKAMELLITKGADVNRDDKVGTGGRGAMHLGA